MNKPSHRLAFGLCLISFFVLMVIWNERGQKFARNVDELQRSVEAPKESKSQEGGKVEEIHPIRNSMRWSDSTPTNSPVCAETK